MNTRRLSVLIFLAAAVFSPLATALFEPGSENRLALGDAVQEKRTTSVNWPFAEKGRTPQASAEEAQPVAMPAPKRFKVLVDVGHGGFDFGAPGHHGILEKEICLRIATNVKLRLERLAHLHDFPLEVKMSRESDHFIPLRDRVKTANQWSADLFISVHANSSPVTRARGFEVYFLSNEASDADASRLARQENGEAATAPLSKGVLSILSDLKTNAHILESSRFAESVYSSLAERLRPNGKGVRQAPFTVLSGTQMPALLIEVGYVTNSDEALSLRKHSYQLRIADGISEGVLTFALQMRRLGKNLTTRLGRTRTI